MDAREEVLTATESLLKSIESADWPEYTRLCAQDLTCFEPEAKGRLEHGIDFHKQFFDQGGHMKGHSNTILEPHVRLLGPDAAVVTYVRLAQGSGPDRRFEETRVWQRTSEGWKHVHFHRSRVTTQP
ncbi:MAG TPA: nuclear transport factor 2 family protein [Fimbriimonadaceae bacterium]|nr:nuclear transport factor 2 family protein [Fimbriimonadaceae bacterium]